MERDKDLEAILAIMTGLSVLHVFFRLELFVGVGAALGIVTLFSRTVRAVIGNAWYKGSEWLGSLMSKIILASVFFLLLLPISFMARLFRSQIIGLQNDKKSFFVTRSHEYKAKDLENPW
jgi:hypothetical protein